MQKACSSSDLLLTVIANTVSSWPSKTSHFAESNSTIYTTTEFASLFVDGRSNHDVQKVRDKKTAGIFAFL